jgi:hypothetical protein
MRNRWFLLMILLTACSRAPQAREELGKMAAAENKLEASEEDLLSQRGALQRERRQITEQRTALIEKRHAPGASRSQIDAEEASLTKREGEILDQETALNRKVDDLLRSRADIVQRATAAAAASATGDSSAQVARREQTVALREKDFARREADLARRETELAGRERDQTKREREQCGPAAPTTIVRTELPKGLRYSQKDVEPVYRKALRQMQDKGILAADLPPSTARLLEDARRAMESGDYVRGKYAADQLLEALGDVKIDRSFIGAKMARLAAAMKGRSLAGEQRKQVDALFQEATTAYGDGKFASANARVNRIFAMLK